MELLSPAGGFERLKYAFHYGADAVYCGSKMLGLRAYADNFDFDELRDAVDFAHALGKKLYVTVNSFLRNSDLAWLDDYLVQLAATKADAFIVTDPAVICACKEKAPDVELHLSTQANTLNTRAAMFWHSLGVKRIVLARELSIGEIKEISQNTPETLELEAFVHGAMCVSYSGRCLLSKLLNGRDGNRGECVQPCRWEYELRERGKGGDWMPIEQDGRGTYVLNSRDLNMAAHIAELIDAGVVSLKIEGRMKTAFYVAAVTNAYRKAVDDAIAGKPFDTSVERELLKLRHRPYTTGFYFGGNEPTEQTDSGRYDQSHEFVAVVLDYDAENGRALIEQRNRFFAGDELELLSPGKSGDIVRIKRLTDVDGEEREHAPHPCEKLWLYTDTRLAPMDILRKDAR